MAKHGYTHGGRPGAKGAGRKDSAAMKLALGIVTGVDLALALALKKKNREETLHAVERDGRVKVLLTQEKETKTE